MQYNSEKIGVHFPSTPSFFYIDWQEQCDTNYLEEIAAVLDSVVTLYGQYFTTIDTSSFLFVINNHPDQDEPMKVYDENIIFLTASKSCWVQFIYQFAHEFCHYIIAKKIVQPMRWFEETICEVASQFFLLKSVEKWFINPPCPGQRDFSAKILDYVLNLQDEISPFSIPDLFNPSSGIIQTLQKKRDIREYNRFVAIKLLPYFIENPSLWEIVYFLPMVEQNKTFGENLHLLQDLSGQPIENIISSLWA